LDEPLAVYGGLFLKFLQVNSFDSILVELRKVCDSFIRKPIGKQLLGILEKLSGNPHGNNKRLDFNLKPEKEVGEGEL